jgi:phosphoglycolate phosphatase-like HAD superfamily hydrolase
MKEVFGTAGPIDTHDFSGKTDPQIARELLHLTGMEDDEIDEGFGQLWGEYLGELETRLPEAPMTVLPGVRDLLIRLEAMNNVALGLLTGNIVEGARLKLGSVGLMDHFPVGGFGSDSEVREELTSVAIRRASSNWGVHFPAPSVVVVGDTPRDVACGKHEGTKTVAVATGRYDCEGVAGTGADRVLEDLGNLDQSVKALLD